MRIPAMSRSFLRFAHMYKLEQVFSAILTSQNGVYFNGRHRKENKTVD